MTPVDVVTFYSSLASVQHWVFRRGTLIHDSAELDILKIKKGYLTEIDVPERNVLWWTSIPYSLLITNSVLLGSLGF